MNQLIKVPETSGQTSILSGGESIKAELLALSAPIRVTDIATRDQAVTAASRIKLHLKQVEADRVAVKAPFLDIGRAIDSTVATHVLELDREAKRLGNEAARFEADRLERLRAEQAAELRRVQQAQRELEQAQREAEQAAIAAAAAKAAQPPEATQNSKETLTALAAELDAEDAAAAAELKATEAKNVLAVAQATATEDKLSGMRYETDITVTDAKALYAAFPLFVDLVPKIAMLKAAAKNGQEFPGVVVTKRPMISGRVK